MRFHLSVKSAGNNFQSTVIINTPVQRFAPWLCLPGFGGASSRKFCFNLRSKRTFAVRCLMKPIFCEIFKRIDRSSGAPVSHYGQRGATQSTQDQRCSLHALSTFDATSAALRTQCSAFVPSQRTHALMGYRPNTSLYEAFKPSGFT
jgi:hypothetical protein